MKRRVTTSLGLGLGALASAVVFGACARMATTANPEQPPWVHRPANVMSVEYTRDLVADTRHHGEPYECGQPEFDVAGRRVFVGSSDHGLYALNAQDGSKLWRFETLGPVQGEPLYDPGDDAVYFGSNDGALYKVAAKTGELAWRFGSNAEVARRPILHEGKLFASNANDTVLALDPTDGELLWDQHRTPALGMEVAGHAGLLVWRGKVFAGFSNGTVTAFDPATGDERWQPVDLAAEAEQGLGELPEYLDLDTTPVPGEAQSTPVVFVGSYAGGVFALDAETGAEIWRNTGVRGVTNVRLWEQAAHLERRSRAEVPARSLLICSTGVSGLWALESETGEIVWHRDLPAGGVSAPVPVARALLVSASQLGVFLFSPLDGRVIDGIHMVDGASGSPNAHGNRAFVLSNGGRLFSLHVSGPRSSRTPRASLWPLDTL